MHLIQQRSSVSLINSAIYGASCVHKNSGYPELGVHPLIQQVAEARRRILAKTPLRKKGFGGDSSDEAYQQAWARRSWWSLSCCVVCIRIFRVPPLGWPKQTDFRQCTICRHSSRHISYAEKKDQFRNGSWVFIARIDISPRPVSVVEKFIKMGRHASNSRLFRRILKTGMRIKLRKELQKERLDPCFYGIHRLGAGGASAAAAVGIPDRLFQRQGEWRSERSKNNYIQETLESLLKITKAIQGWELYRLLSQFLLKS